MQLLNLLVLLVTTVILNSSDCDASSEGVGRVDGRYSFSLTTFDPSGKLRQVEHATRAASLGTPVIATCLDDNTIIFATPRILPSPLVNDDGTRKFCQICPGITLAHSGVSADGRSIVAEAQRMAVEYAYMFDEDIPIQHFLEELSSLFQKYTMKPGARPFGCSVLVANVRQDDEGGSRIYRIGPSGSVEMMGRVGIIGSDATDMRQFVENGLTGDLDGSFPVLCEGLRRENEKIIGGAALTTRPKLAFLTASLSKNGLLLNPYPVQ